MALKIALYMMYLRTRVVTGTSSVAAITFILSPVQFCKRAESQFFVQLLPVAMGGVIPDLWIVLRDVVVEILLDVISHLGCLIVRLDHWGHRADYRYRGKCTYRVLLW